MCEVLLSIKVKAPSTIFEGAFKWGLSPIVLYVERRLIFLMY